MRAVGRRLSSESVCLAEGLLRGLLRLLRTCRGMNLARYLVGWDPWNLPKSHLCIGMLGGGTGERLAPAWSRATFQWWNRAIFFSFSLTLERSRFCAWHQEPHQLT